MNREQVQPQGPDAYADATHEYRSWLGTRLAVTEAGWASREQALATIGPFEFLRATFYRWSQWWPVVCRSLDDAPSVLGVGDLHIENFGVWRDAEGRLVWGVNDFDECCCLPYTNDLVRLATSAWFAISEDEMGPVVESAIKGEIVRSAAAVQLGEIGDRAEKAFKKACGSILDGYQHALDPDRHDAVRRPFVLAEPGAHSWLREIVVRRLGSKDKGPFDKFLGVLTSLPKVDGPVPLSAWEALTSSMPEPGMAFRVGQREAGLGSLGRQRFTAVVDDWRGGILAREAKALAPSAWGWWKAEGHGSDDILYDEVVRHAVRAPDPWVRVVLGRQSWVVRRLAPDAGRIELKDLPKGGDLEDDLLRAMGHETANVHVQLGDVWTDLKKKEHKHPGWLTRHARLMADRVLADWATL